MCFHYLIDTFAAGYTEDAVIMLGDKKIGKEAHNLRSTFEATDDGCRDFVEAVSWKL